MNSGALNRFDQGGSKLVHSVTPPALYGLPIDAGHMSNSIKTEARFFVKEIGVTLFVRQYEERGVEAPTCQAFFCDEIGFIGRVRAKVGVRA